MTKSPSRIRVRSRGPRPLPPRRSPRCCACRQEADVVPLTDPALWGRAVDDERHLVLSIR